MGRQNIPTGIDMVDEATGGFACGQTWLWCGTLDRLGQILSRIVASGAEGCSVKPSLLLSGDLAAVTPHLIAGMTGDALSQPDIMNGVLSPKQFRLFFEAAERANTLFADVVRCGSDRLDAVHAGRCALFQK